VDDGGRIFLLTNIVSDWIPQTDKPAEPNYVSVSTTGRAKVAARMDRRNAGSRPYWGGVVVTVYDGDLAPGDRVTIVVGDRSGGSRGAAAPMIVPNQISEIRFAVDPLNNSTPVRVGHSPRVEIVASEAVRLEAVWPSEAAPGGQTWLLVKAKDAGGNAATGYRGLVRFGDAAALRGLPRTYRFTEADRGFRRFEGIGVPRSGTLSVRVTDSSKPALTAQSNVLAVVHDSSLRPYCGDLHGQHVVGSSDAERFAEHAKGFGGIDFMSWAINDFHLTDAVWRRAQTLSREMNSNGRFVVFPGYEWSATTGRGGDHNVVHLNEGETLYRSGYVEHDLRGYDPATDRHSMTDLAKTLDPARTLLMPHIGGRRANLDFFDPRFMHFIEMYSDHGQFEWFLREALSRGLRVGFVASSDDAFGKLGDSPPGSSGLFAVHGGFTCAYADELSREGLWRAFMRRRVYGTTGERMQMRWRAGDRWMGEEVASRTPVTLSLETSGTAGIERIEVFRGTELVHRYQPQPAGQRDLIKVIWRGAASRERARQTLWKGRVGVQGARIVSIEPYRLDHSGETVRLASPESVELDTLTSGDEDGVILQVDASESARLAFEAVTSPRNQFGAQGAATTEVKFAVALAEVTAEDHVQTAGGVDREVVIRRIGTGYPRSVQMQWTEPSTPPGLSAYWVRVLQTDGATAWSSPIFVTR
jgi:hypothetical protein